MQQVFLSSTAKDLDAYRDKVAEAIHRLDGFNCIRMEEFGARELQADAFCRNTIADCAVAVFIVGLCYGSQPEGAEDSYTVREYAAAVSAGLACLVFLSAEGVYYPGYYRESDQQWQRQQEFRTKLHQEHIQIGRAHV